MKEWAYRTRVRLVSWISRCSTAMGIRGEALCLHDLHPRTATRSPESSLLTPADIDHFKQRLETQRETLLKRIASLQQELAAPDQYAEATLERGDDATLLQAHDNAWDQLAFSRNELAQVDRALARIADGTYGTSEVSGRPIPRERLEARPSATTLVDEASKT
jgi:RNA polymerase-binding transcription factor DksA